MTRSATTINESRRVRLHHRRRGFRRLRVGQPALRRSAPPRRLAGGGAARPQVLDCAADRIRPRGRVLGGSSSINGLIAIRGQHEDYDHWAGLGNTGWSWNDVLPYFVKSESNPDHAESQLHGSGGPTAVSSIKRRHELIEAFIASAQARGIPRTDDFNGESQEGA